MRKIKPLGITALLSILLFTGCPDPNIEKVEAEDTSSKIEISSEQVGMNCISFIVTFNDSEAAKSIKTSLYAADDLENRLDWDFQMDTKVVYVKFDNRYKSGSDLKIMSGTEYKVVITVMDSMYKDFTKTISFTTKPKGSPSITSCEYEKGTTPCVAVSYDEAPTFVNKLELWRSEEENGEYTNVKETTYIDVSSKIRDSSIEENKKYYYKLKAYENIGTYEDENYELIGESSVKSVETGYAVPKEVDISKVKYTKGVKTFTVTWPKIEGAIKYNVWIQKNRSSAYLPEEGDIIAQYEAAADETSYQFKNLKPNTPYDFYITVTTLGGTSNHNWTTISTTTPKFKRSGYSDYAKVIAGQDNATYMPALTFDEYDDFEFYFTLRKSSDENSDILYGIEKVENVTSFVVEGLSPATYYSSYSDNRSGYIHLTAKYLDSDGVEQTVKDYIQASSFTTNGLDAPSNVQVVSSTANTATISFDEITDEQKFGKNVTYKVSAYNSDNYVSMASGSTSPITVSDLIKGTSYRFEVETTFSGAASIVEKNTATCYGNTLSGITSKPVITKLSEVAAAEYHRGIRTNIQVEFNEIEVEGMDSADFVYGIEYKIFDKSSFKKAQEDFIFDEENEFIELTSANAVSGTFTQNFLVNAGNNYKVRLSAYNINDSTDIVYSDVEEIQLKAIDDSVTFAALLYPEGNTIGAEAGAMVEFTNPKVWEGETEIRSSKTEGYKIGYIQLMGEIESTKILFPKSTGAEWVAAKFNFTEALNAENIPRIIIIDRSAFPFASNAYGYFNAVYINMPNEQGTIIEKFEDDIDNKKYIYEDFNMPYFDSTTGKTTTSPSNAGKQIEEEWVFNNSLYLGVKQTIPGNLGFSYYY